MAIAYIGLGANLGDRLATLRVAVDRLRELGDVEAVSSVYETDPVGYADQPPFLNAAVKLRTALIATELLTRLLAIERDLGRRRTFRNAPRTVDLDVLLYDNAVIDTPDLIVPHPRMHERAFVLVPLAEIAPVTVHPVFGRTVAELLTELKNQGGVRGYSTLL